MAVVYIETSIVSYLRQRPAAHVVAAARQLLTRRWWDEERQHYRLVTSQAVRVEAGAGNPSLATERIKLLDGIPLLDITSQVAAIANEVMTRMILPKSARIDALHIAVAAFYRVDYLLTWNCAHIANARILPRIRSVLSELGVFVPIICTPEEMVDDTEG